MSYEAFPELSKENLKTWCMLAHLNISGKKREEVLKSDNILEFLEKNKKKESFENIKNKKIINLKELDLNTKIIFEKEKLGRLNRCMRPPLLIYLSQEFDLVKNNRPVISIVGSRRASPKGLKRAYDLAYKLTKLGVLIVSGGAYGIDIAAHEGALDAGGQTLSILGEPYPKEKNKLPSRLKKFSNNSNFIYGSTFSPWSRGMAVNFVIRNQYVAGLADEVILVEGLEKSGAIHTVNYANQMGVNCWTIPGCVDDLNYRANNNLLFEKSANALISIDKFVSFVGEKYLKNNLNKQNQNINLELFEEKPEKIKFKPRCELTQLLVKQDGRITLDDVCAALTWPMFKIQEELLKLELEGLISKNGAEFVLSV